MCSPPERRHQGSELMCVPQPGCERRCGRAASGAPAALLPGEFIIQCCVGAIGAREGKEQEMAEGGRSSAKSSNG